MRNDSMLRSDLLDELKWDPSIRNEDIAIAVKDGVVTLAGTVDTFMQRYAAQRAVERVNGVAGIANDLAVKLPGAMERSDSDIAHAAVNALRWDVQVPDEHVKVKVTQGWLTLEGQVNFFFQKDAAERAVRSLAGVKSVSNLIALRPIVTPADVKTRITSAFGRQAKLDASEITVETIGSRVMLHGSVRSHAERCDAERAAWNAPGVMVVENELYVRSLVPALL